MTNMTVKQSFLTNLWMELLFLMSSSGATLESYQSRSLIVFYEYLSHHNETIHHHQHSSFLTNMTVRQSFSTKIEIFEVQSFSSWCHYQGQPWRRGSSVSFLILMSYQSSPLIVFNETSFISLSLIHGTIHYHQQSSFLTNMTVKQSFLTNLWMEFLFLMSSWGATLESYQSRSLIVFYEYLSHHNETIHHHQHSSFLTNMTVGHCSSTKLEIFEVQSFSSCRLHHQ